MIEKEIGGYTVRIDKPLMRFGVYVWIYQRRGDEVYLLLHANELAESTSKLTWTKVNPTLDFSDVPTFHMDEAVLAALTAVWSDVEPPNSSMQNHLTDTRQQRDRMLAMVEKVVAGFIEPRLLPPMPSAGPPQ